MRFKNKIERSNLDAMGQTVTIKDVASRAEVSVGTVSRVLNGQSGIAPERLARVNQAIQELGYRKHSLAQVLASRRGGSAARTGNLGIVFAEFSNAWVGHPLISRYFSGVEKACREEGYHAIVEIVRAADELPDCVADGKIDGLLIKATNTRPAFIEKLPEGLPVVGVAMSEPSCSFAQVSPDNIKGGWVVAEYLWNAGHRRIAFICSDPRHRMFIGRYQGYEEYLRSHGAFVPENVMMQSAVMPLTGPESVFPDLTESVRKLWNRPADQRPTAVIAANDWMAGGIYAAAQDLGIQIPRDISVIGADNSTEVCGVLRPALSSYAVPVTEAAYAAAQMLLDQIRNPEKPRIAGMHTVVGQLIERASVKVLRV